MRDTKYFCDKCGKPLIDERYTIDGIRWHNIQTGDFSAGFGFDMPELNPTLDKLEGFDFCEGCMRKVLNSIMRCVESEEPEPATNKKVDLGKIRALRDAGWTQKAIAEEMHVTPPTIAYHLKQMGLTEGK